MKRELLTTHATLKMSGLEWNDYVFERQNVDYGCWLEDKCKNWWQSQMLFPFYLATIANPSHLTLTIPVTFMAMLIMRKRVEDKYLKWATEFHALEKLKIND